MAENIESFLETLNPPQKEAALHTQGALMIIAGAGSGKTRVLTYRIAHLLTLPTEPFRILALTFTNKAAEEMRKRIQDLAGKQAKYIWMGTFHSIFARILRQEVHRLGFTKDFTIYDTDDSKNLIKTILRERKLDDKVYKIGNIYGRISRMKNQLISYKNYLEEKHLIQEDEQNKIPEFKLIYQLYQTRCFRANAMDFDDLLFMTNILFRDHEEVREKFQNQFHYILIDEFQDTNFAQYNLVKMLSQKHRNICVVGDDAQSIYAFRGADIQNILNFEKDYPELKTVRLEQNYRSTQSIVQTANSVIAYNRNQLEKKVWTSNEDGSLIKLVRNSTDTEEGRMVADTIFFEKMNNSRRNSDFAVLYRTNAQSRKIEDALREKNIKYRLISGLSFYQRKEIKDLVAYLRLVINSNDEEAFKRVINFPKRGIGDTTVEKIFEVTQTQRLKLWDVVRNISQHATGRAISTIYAFSEMIEGFKSLLESQDAYFVARNVANTCGIIDDLKKDDNKIEGISRLENIQELLNGIKEFVDNPENEDKSLSAFLQQISLLTTADESDNQEDHDKVTLITIHGSKGLEFPYVFIVGIEEELFPSMMMSTRTQDIEEERRLFYVAITRAEENLVLSYARQRYYYGNVKETKPSRFLKEINPTFLTMVGGKLDASQNRYQNRQEQTEKSSGYSFVKQFRPTNTITQNTNYNHTPSANFRPSDPRDMQVGMRVEHQKFGFGEIVQTQMEDSKMIVDFESRGKTTLVMTFAKLMICE